MGKKRNYKVGDKIIEYGQVFKIFKIKRQENGEGELERVIYFRPYYQQKEDRGIICSIPLKNMKKALIRRPVSRQEMGEHVKNLKMRKRKKDNSDPDNTKDLLNSNDLIDVVKVVKSLWREKKEKSGSFSKTKKDAFNLAVDRLVQEFALVKGVSLQEAREEILLTLR